MCQCGSVCVYLCLCVYLQIGDKVGVGNSTHVPLSRMRPLGQVQTGPLGLSRHSHSHFFLSQGLVTDKNRARTGIKNKEMPLLLYYSCEYYCV